MRPTSTCPTAGMYPPDSGSVSTSWLTRRTMPQRLATSAPSRSRVPCPRSTESLVCSSISSPMTTHAHMTGISRGEHTARWGGGGRARGRQKWRRYHWPMPLALVLRSNLVPFNSARIQLSSLSGSPVGPGLGTSPVESARLGNAGVCTVAWQRHSTSRQSVGRASSRWLVTARCKARRIYAKRPLQRQSLMDFQA